VTEEIVKIKKSKREPLTYYYQRPRDDVYRNSATHAQTQTTLKKNGRKEKPVGKRKKESRRQGGKRGMAFPRRKA